MAVPIIGNSHGVVYFGPKYDPACQRWWAERGMLHVEDSENTYDTLTVKEFLLRVKEINDMIGNSRKATKDSKLMDSEEIDRHQRFIDQACDLAKKAQEQGMPSDQSAVHDLKRRRKCSVVVPGLKGTF